jgi:hypothetical protein
MSSLLGVVGVEAPQPMIRVVAIQAAANFKNLIFVLPTLRKVFNAAKPSYKEVIIRMRLDSRRFFRARRVP